jgi:hypothetical protein
MSDYSGGGVIGHEISGMRREQAMFEKEMASSKDEFAEYLKRVKDDIQVLNDEMSEVMKVPAERLYKEKAHKEGFKGFLRKLSNIFK